MENQKNNKGIIALLIVIIVILSALCVLFATGTISFKSSDVDNNETNQNVNENNNINNNDDNDNKENENTNLPKWANYLLEQNITEIKYEKGVLEHDETNNTEKCTPTKTMTKDQLESVLLKMTKSKLRKFDAGGFGGPCWGGIIVKYDNQEFRIFMGKFIVADNNDSHILSLIEQENYTLDSQRYNQEPLWTYEYDWETSYIDTLF